MRSTRHIFIFCENDRTDSSSSFASNFARSLAIAKWKPFGRFSGFSAKMPWASHKLKCGTTDSKMAAFRWIATFVPVGSQKPNWRAHWPSADFGLAGPSCHRPRTCGRGGDKHWFATFHFDRRFGHAEIVREIHDKAPDKFLATDSNFFGQTQHSCGSTGFLLSRHGSLRFLAVPPPEDASERDSIWVTRRHYTEHDGQTVLQS